MHDVERKMAKLETINLEDVKTFLERIEKEELENDDGDEAEGRT